MSSLSPRRHPGLLLAACLLCLACTSARTPRNGWELLGERTVNHTVDRDEIAVTGREGTFRQIKLQVRRAAVTFRDVKIHYANGAVQDVELRRAVKAGGETRAIDLTGTERVISKVTFFYDTRPVRGERAVVRLLGLE